MTSAPSKEIAHENPLARPTRLRAGCASLKLSLAHWSSALDATGAPRELKEQAIGRRGKISQRFETCNVCAARFDPHRPGLLKYARSKGAGEKHQSALIQYFNEGRARVRHLRKGFSPEECEA